MVKYRVIRNCFCESYLYEKANYQREGLIRKKLHEGDVVEFHREWQNLYGIYYRVIKGDLHYDIKPENLEEIKDDWIKLSDKLPKVGERVLVFTHKGYMGYIIGL